MKFLGSSGANSFFVNEHNNVVINPYLPHTKARPILHKPKRTNNDHFPSKSLLSSAL